MVVILMIIPCMISASFYQMRMLLWVGARVTGRRSCGRLIGLLDGLLLVQAPWVRPRFTSPCGLRTSTGGVWEHTFISSVGLGGYASFGRLVSCPSETQLAFVLWPALSPW